MNPGPYQGAVPPDADERARVRDFLARQKPWDQVSRQAHDEHRFVCDFGTGGCVWCDGHRAEGFCRACGTNTEVMDDGNCSCGGQILLGIDWGTR